MHPHSEADARFDKAWIVRLLFNQGTTGRDCLCRMIVAGDERDEERHDAVAKEFVDDAAVAVDGAVGDGVEMVQQMAESRSANALGEARRFAFDRLCPVTIVIALPTPLNGAAQTLQRGADGT